MPSAATSIATAVALALVVGMALSTRRSRNLEEEGGDSFSSDSGGAQRSAADGDGDGDGHYSWGPVRVPLYDGKPGLEVRVLGPGLVLIKGALNMEEQLAIARDQFYHGHAKQRWWLQTDKVTNKPITHLIGRRSVALLTSPHLVPPRPPRPIPSRWEAVWWRRPSGS